MALIPVDQEDKPKLVPVNRDKPRLVPIQDAKPRLVPIAEATSSSNFKERFGLAFDMARKAVPFPNLLGGNKATEFIEQPAELSKRGLKMMTDKIPDAETTSATANVALNLGGSIPKILAEFAPEFLRPRNLLLGDTAFGQMAKGVRESTGFIKMTGKVSAAIPAAIKRSMTYRYGQPEIYKELAEQRVIDIGNGIDKAISIGKELTENLTQGEQLRVAQIIRGGVSVGQAEEVLRGKAGMARTALDALEREAKDLDLIPENALLKFTKADLAGLRNKKALIDARINKIRNYGAFQQKEALLGKASKVDITGRQGLEMGVRQTGQRMQDFREALDEAKDHLTEQEFKSFEDILAMPSWTKPAMSGRGGVQKTLEKYQKMGVGEQEKIFNQLSSLAEKIGVKIDTINSDKLKVSNIQGLITQIENVSGRFPGQTALLRNLESKSTEIQKTIADSYRTSGQKYLPRLYASKELESKIPGVSIKPNRVITDRFLKRTDIPEDIRKGMGEILEAGYPTAKGIAQVSNAIATHKLFRKVVQNQEWSTLDASDAALRGFTKLGENKNLGELAGKFVHPEIARDINEITRVTSDWEKLYGSVLSKWKFGKTVFGFPATHSRNMIGSVVMHDLGGMNQIEQLSLVPMAAMDLIKKGSWAQRAKATGLLGHEFYGGEITAFRDSIVQGRGPILNRLAKHSEKMASTLESIGRNSSAVADKLGRMYQAQDQSWKLAKFIKNVKSGMTDKEAAVDAAKYGFDYTKVSPFIRAARKLPLGSPFITYTSKALPIVAETALTNPLRVWKYELLFKAMENTAIDKGIATAEEIETVKKNSYGKIAILPFKDENGDLMKIDLSYLLPWGDIGESGGWGGLPSVASPSGPLNIIIDLGRNNSTFKAANGMDPKIWQDTDLPNKKIKKATDYALKAFLPSITPGVPTDDSFFKGGYTFQKLSNAIQKKPDYFGRVREPFLVMMDAVLGIKISPADPELMKSFEMIRKNKQAEEARLETLKVIRHPGVADSYKAKRLDSYIEKIERIFKK